MVELVETKRDAPSSSKQIDKEVSPNSQLRATSSKFTNGFDKIQKALVIDSDELKLRARKTLISVFEVKKDIGQESRRFNNKF
jgi:hypothetical protein